MTSHAENSDNSRSSVRLAPIEVPKASDILANELRERILAGEFPEGSALPTERDLVTQTMMSRTTVREALRILEVQDLIKIKAGRAGGSFVHRPDEESLASSLSLLIRGRKIRLTSLLETRVAIEPFCAELAARNRTDADLEALDDADERIEEKCSLADFLQTNVDWHVAVAIASHNELLTGFMIALSRAIYTATENEGFIDDEVRRTAARAHRTITAAIRDQDADAAARRMRRHVHSYAEAALKIEQREAITVPGTD